MPNFSINGKTVSQETINTLAKKIKPVVDFDKKGLCYIQDVDLYQTAFTWDPQPAKAATNLKKLKDIVTFHTWGAPIYFKPSIAEVLAQIPEEDRQSVVAFEIVGEPIVNGRFHQTKTRLYIKE